MDSFKNYILLLCLLFFACGKEAPRHETAKAPFISFDESSILKIADSYLSQAPVPLTDFICERSAGNKHDFYSEGDYWWPNPDDPEGPYIRRDGESNPENFTAHREAMWNFGRWTAALTAAYKISGDEKYADHALLHLKAWLTDEETMMSPHLLYAQAIKGRVTGRGIGIIDAIHLIEVAKSIQVLNDLGYLKEEDFSAMQNWFATFVDWLSIHPYGIDERDHGNNHSTWWAAQVAVFADLAGRDDLLALCRSQFKKLMEEQLDEKGGFPDELSRTKPYNYSLFNLEGYSILAHVASIPEDDLWNWQGSKGGLRQAWDFMHPFIADKSTWHLPPDVQHFDELPIQSAGLLFAGKAWNDEAFFKTWNQLDPTRKSNEIDRVYPIRQPLLWVDGH